MNLNTSHVLINLYDMLAKRIMNTNLNTSHVLINPAARTPFIRELYYLNTSHVLINQTTNALWRAGYEFKYISCSY